MTPPVALHALALLPILVPHPSRPGSGDTVLRDGDIVRGDLFVDTLRIPEDATVWVDGELNIAATGLVRIQGRLVAFDAGPLGRLDAPSIRIHSNLVIDVPGTILGGSGTDGSDTEGGRGSNVTLSAPLVYIDGSAQAGSAGRGGAGRAGGRGGDARVDGYFLVRQPSDDHVSLRSGRGGDGGYPGGDGGESGDAVAFVSAELRESISGSMPAIAAALSGLAAEDPPPGQGCANGTPGGDGGNSASGNGGEGADSAHGTAGSPAGSNGGDGRKSGDCTGGDGLNANPGLDCCPNTGGTGGKGGKGGNAQSGNGGKGGKGGDGYQGLHPGGKGGHGADSGFAKGGRSGNGGNGGKRFGVGGAAGDPAGVVTAGAAGAAGNEGSRNPNGTNGTPGSPGTVTGSSIGTAGNPGGDCP